MFRPMHLIVGTAACVLMLQATDASAGGLVAQRAARFPDFVPFDFNQMEFPEGVAVDKFGNVYASVGTSAFGPLPDRSDQVWKFTTSGAKSMLADFGPPRGAGLGLAVDAVGNVYMARGISATPQNGVYRVGKDGTIVQVQGTDQIVFPNALAFDHRGTLYVSETFSVDPSSGDFTQGGIWRVPKGGTAELWLRDDLLTGLPPILFPYPVGANGLAFYHGDLYAINTDKALVVRVPILPDGSPGQAEIWKQVEDVPEAFGPLSAFPLQIDGLAFDVLGNSYVTVPSRSAIVRINADDRSQETFAVYPEVPLDAPLNLAFGTGKGERKNIFVTNGGVSGLFIPGLPWPGPGLVKIEVGVPGYPVPAGCGVVIPEPAAILLALVAATGMISFQRRLKPL
jgi:sugar lactone lactonase YvrE